jgi:hypothetical protein
MSADSVVPNPNDTYSYDRYAYCRNNPVNLTDPTGHAFGLDDLALAILIGALVGGAMAAINGANIFEGMALGAVSGALFGGAEYLGLGIGGAMAAGAVSGAINAAVYGGNIFQSALIGAGAAAIGHGIGAAGGSKGGVYAVGHTWEKAAVSVLSGGVVGGLSSVAMGGDFWQGFTQGAANAGLSFAANEIAGEIEANANARAENDKAYADWLSGKRDSPLVLRVGSSGDNALWPAGHSSASSLIEPGPPLADTSLNEYRSTFVGLNNMSLRDNKELFFQSPPTYKGMVHADVGVWWGKETQVAQAPFYPDRSYDFRGHVHPIAGTSVSSMPGMVVSFGPSWQDTRAALFDVEHGYKGSIVILQETAPGALHLLEFHCMPNYQGNPNLTAFQYIDHAF